MERNWQKLPISSPTSPTLSSDDVLGALRNGRLAGANGKNSVLLVLRRKAVEIYDASEAAQAQRHKETLKHLATAACNLVYAILSANEQVPLQDRTLNHVENLLDRVLHAIRTIQGSSSTSVVYRSFLRRKGPSVSEAQLQNYVDQLYHMLFQFQECSSLSQRINTLEDRARLEEKNPSIFDDTNSLPFPPPHFSSVSGVSATAMQYGSSYDRIVPNDTVEARSGPSASNPVRCNSNNPFLPFIESGFPRDASHRAAPFAHPVATDISLRSSHVGGSSSTVSKVDNSTKENYNNVINNITHNMTTNFNGNIFIPVAFGYPSSPGLGGAYNPGYLGYNVRGGNDRYNDGNGAGGAYYGGYSAHNGNGSWDPISNDGNGDSSTNDRLRNYRRHQ